MESPSRSVNRSGAGALIYTVVATIALLAGWEALATSFWPAASAPGQSQNLPPDASSDGGVITDFTNNDDLKAFVRTVPPCRLPRVMVLGSSQIATVKDRKGRRDKAMPGQLHGILSRRGPCEVVDVSAGGQVMVESMRVLFGTWKEVQPKVVVIGLGLFSMQGSAPREAILAAFPREDMQAVIRRSLPPEVPPDVAEGLVGPRGDQAAAETQDKSARDRIDEYLGDFLSRNLNFVASRREMFNSLVDRPIRKDLAAWVNRNVRATKVARTYEIPAAYEPSLAALSAMGRFCREKGVPLVVVILPFESTRTPPPYLRETQQRVTGDLIELSQKHQLGLVDLGYLLEPKDFGLYMDGSPDGLHYREHGHQLVAELISDAVTPLLGLAKPASEPATPKPGDTPQ